MGARLHREASKCLVKICCLRICRQSGVQKGSGLLQGLGAWCLNLSDLPGEEGDVESMDIGGWCICPAWGGICL